MTNFILDQTEDGYGAILCRMKSFVFGNCRVKDKVIAINEIKGTGLLITTAHEGLILYHSDTKECKVYNKSNCPEFPADAFRSVYVDSKQEAWFEMTEWGKGLSFQSFDRSI